MGALARLGRLLLGGAALGAALWWGIPHLWPLLFPAPTGTALRAVDGTELTELGGTIDRALAEALLSSDIGAQAVIAQREEPRERGAIGWLHQEIDIDLPEGVTPAQLRDRLAGALADEERVEVYLSAVDEITAQLRLYAGGFPTHVVRLHPHLPDDPVAGEQGARIAVLLTGLEADERWSERFLRMPEPLTIAIAAFQPDSLLLAQAATRASKEVVLELAPQSEDDSWADALRAVPYISGAVDTAGVLDDPLLQALAARDLYAIDSATGNGLRARAYQIPLLDRLVVFPSEGGSAARDRALRAVKNLAVRRGYAVLLVEPGRAQVEAVEALFGAGRDLGYQFVFASEAAARLALEEGPS